MKLPGDTHITYDQTVDDWFALREKLTTENKAKDWEDAYKDFFQKRLEERYLNPVLAIRNNSLYTGEGFAIMSILCSLVEFLESTWQGINYRYAQKDADLGPYEYRKSSKIFRTFLVSREPFNIHFNASQAEGFYNDVRCGVLHEARTKGKWTISATSASDRILEEKADKVVIYRNQFADAIESFINKIYREALIADDERKSAFIRKFDAICSELKSHSIPK